MIGKNSGNITTGKRKNYLCRLHTCKKSWVEETSLFNEDFVKSYNEGSDIGYFLELDVQCP